MKLRRAKERLGRNEHILTRRKNIEVFELYCAILRLSVVSLKPDNPSVGNFIKSL
jgi:hypothetical protein